MKPTGCGLLVAMPLALAACQTCRPITAPLATSLPTDPQIEVRITRRSGAQVSLVQARIAGDSLFGREPESGVPLAFVLTDIVDVEQRIWRPAHYLGPALVVATIGGIIVLIVRTIGRMEFPL